MKSFFQILGSHTVDAYPSILLFFDSKRYLFSCGEGLQRLCTQNKIKLTKLEAIFIPRLNWEVFGGVPGISKLYKQLII